MAARTVMGPMGAPMRPPYGSFAGKPASGGGQPRGHVSVMGPAGAPMRALYGSFTGRSSEPPSQAYDWLVMARRRSGR